MASVFLLLLLLFLYLFSCLTAQISSLRQGVLVKFSKKARHWGKNLTRNILYGVFGSLESSPKSKLSLSMSASSVCGKSGEM
jgi:hypothetical protein